MQNVCACGNQTRNQSRTRDVSEGVLFVRLLPLVSGWRIRKDFKFVDAFSSQPWSLSWKANLLPVSAAQSSLKSGGLSGSLERCCVTIFAFHLYSIEYFQATNLLHNEGASLAQFQPLISSSWNNWQARWWNHKRKRRQKNNYCHFKVFVPGVKLPVTSPDWAVVSGEPSPQPKRMLFIDVIARILTPGLIVSLREHEKKINKHQPFPHLECRQQQCSPSHLKEITTLQKLLVADRNSQHIHSLRAGSILSSSPSANPLVQMGNRAFFYVESKMMGWSWWIVDLCFINDHDVVLAIATVRFWF